MMKYFLLCLILFSFAGFAQDYKVQIAQHRENYKKEFLHDKRSPLKESDLSFLRFYDADSSYRVNAQATMLLAETAFIMPVISGVAGSEYIPYALLKFTLKGKPLELTIYKNTALAKRPEYADYLFLPFTDATNGSTTYGGGRYLDFREGDFKNGTLLVDFNKAYNPYCAFGAGYACPKPPAENQLSIAIEAGEQNFAQDKKH